MRRALLYLIAAGSLVAGASKAVAAGSSPVVVELFTAQGCTACTGADAVLDSFVGRKGVLALTFPVDYWDYLGWRDTFAQPAFTDRQRAYATRLKVKEIYTPEIVVGGRGEASGLDRQQVGTLITSETGARRDGPTIRFSRHDAQVRVGAGAEPPRNADVWLVRYDPVEHDVRIKAGENKGKTMVARNVVRELMRLGSWSGRPRSYALPNPREDGLKTVVMIQAARGGRVIAAARG